MVLFITVLLPHKKVCFRCKSRSCPHCGVKVGTQWIQWIQYLLSLVPDCPWQHIVFTLPCQYWSLVFMVRKFLKREFSFLTIEKLLTTNIRKLSNLILHGISNFYKRSCLSFIHIFFTQARCIGRCQIIRRGWITMSPC